MLARYKFCLWLVNKLIIRRMTLAEICDEWHECRYNIKGITLTPRTFLRYKSLAEEIFDVNIEYDRSSNEYRLDMDTLDNSDRWTMSALSVQNLMSMSNLRKFIILEDPPAGQDILEIVANACRDNRILRFTYKSPYRSPRDFEVTPLFVKLFKQRWYLFCRPFTKDYISTIALDRISSLSVGGRNPYHRDISPDEYLSDCYGIIHQHEAEKIVLRAFWPQNTYLKEKPLHHSQEIVEDTNDWTDFSLYIRPTYDFKQDLLWHRDKLVVLSPDWLRDDLIDILGRMINSYRTGLPHCKDE